MCTHICGHQLLGVVDAQHGDFALADERVVVWIGGYQHHLCDQMETAFIPLCRVSAALLFKDINQKYI